MNNQTRKDKEWTPLAIDDLMKSEDLPINLKLVRHNQEPRKIKGVTYEFTTFIHCKFRGCKYELRIIENEVKKTKV